MRGSFQFGLTVLVALLLFMAPGQALLCQQACALCVHAPTATTAATVQHCMGMAMASPQDCVQSAACCVTNLKTPPAVLSAAGPDLDLPASAMSVDASPLPAPVMAVSLERAAPPGVYHPPVVALRV